MSMSARKMRVRTMVVVTELGAIAAAGCVAWVAAFWTASTAWVASIAGSVAATGRRARTMAKPIQPTRSLSMAEEMMSMPMSDFAMLRSSRIFAMTGRAVIDMAMPRKMEKGS